MDSDWPEEDALDDDALLSLVTKAETEDSKPDSDFRSNLSPLQAIETCQDICGPPVKQIRPGYIWVSDICSQLWCEAKLVYSLTVPGIPEENPLITAGTDIHLARELEIQDKVAVSVESREDSFAVKLLNMTSQMDALMIGAPRVREIPIFGTPFSGDIFVMGVIDEIRYDTDNLKCDIYELKTRGSKTLPKKSQKSSHQMQVMLYKHLFDWLILADVESVKSAIKKHLKHDLHKELGTELIEHMKTSGVVYPCLDLLLDALCEKLKRFTFISELFVEYCYQGDKSTIGIEQVHYDQLWFEEQFKKLSEFWTGKRKANGVDIEEAWKCQSCDFSEICEWRMEKAKECAKKNQKRL